MLVSTMPMREDGDGKMMRTMTFSSDKRDAASPPKFSPCHDFAFRARSVINSTPHLDTEPSHSSAVRGWVGSRKYHGIHDEQGGTGNRRSFIQR